MDKVVKSFNIFVDTDRGTHTGNCTADEYELNLNRVNIDAARNHFDKMIKSCEKDVPKNGWLFGESPSIADIMFVSTLIPCSKFNINIKSDKVNNYLQRAKNRKHYNNAYNDCFNI